MSWQSCEEPVCSGQTGVFRTIVKSRSRDLGGFSVRRVLPAAACRHVGPFIFLDQMGPATFPAGDGIDVRPHPHIGLETVTYLFDGEILHRDSLGVVQPIRPGEVNWMTAGCGIVHSERTGEDERARPSSLYGIQAWVALPDGQEETDPAFVHYDKADLPEIELGGIWVRLIAGEAFGAGSPVSTGSRLFYAHAEAPAGSTLTLPGDFAERAVYVVSGRLASGGTEVEAGELGVVETDTAGVFKVTRDSRLMLLGGDPPASRRHLWWNLVSSSPERIEQAKADWRNGRFPEVPGDDEFIPLPER